MFVIQPKEFNFPSHNFMHVANTGRQSIIDFCLHALKRFYNNTTQLDLIEQAHALNTQGFDVP